MCLVLAFTNTKKLNLSQCLNDIGNTLLKEEDDGFGYAIQGQTGVFGEKTIAKRFHTRLGRPGQVTLPIVKKTYMSFGTPSKLGGPGIFHGRTSTNVISLRDTHPMIRPATEGGTDLWYLIHNGVVTDKGPQYKKLTNNDSEDVLKRLLDSVGKPNPMEAIEEFLEGYYAFAAIDASGRLHVARDCYAPLHIAWSSKFDTFIIGTTESLILKVSKILEAKIGPIDEITDETYCIFQGNELIHCQDFKSLGYTTAQSRHAGASLGRVLPSGQTAAPQVCGLTPPRNVVASSTAIETASESQWEDSIMDFLKRCDNATVREISEDEYYKYRREIDNLDASYEIFGPDNAPMTILDFKKLDHISQEQCTILRGDGTVVDPEDYSTPHYRKTEG